MALSPLDELLLVYTAARLKIIEIVLNTSGVGTKVYYNTVLKQITKIIDELALQTNGYIDTAIPLAYKTALDEIYDYFKSNNLLMKNPENFAVIHEDTIAMLTNEMRKNVGDGLEQVGRRVKRYLDESRDLALRKTGLAATAEKAAMGATVRDMKNSMADKLAEQGFMTVQYGSGAKAYQVSLDAYTALCARTTTAEAGNYAREKQLTENGYDLMKMTSHYPTCPLCARLQGRVYSISGDDKRFPALSVAFPNGYRTVHPNCAHRVVPFVESMQSEVEMKQAISDSNKPFDDLQGDEEKALYNNQQKMNKTMRDDRSQYEQYKLRLGDDAPKSFHEFRKIKKASGDKWGNLEKKYRETS